jgi:GTP-binding protein
VPAARIAIVGRPNVGKSSLLNMLAGGKVSIVDPVPGVTRDRVSAVVDLPAPAGAGPPRRVEIIDTGGFGVYTAEGKGFNEVGDDLAALTGPIEEQIALAVRSADIVLLCVDCRAGVTPADREVARLLRAGALGRSRRGAGPSEPARVIRVVATKCDGPRWEAHAMEPAELGLGEPLPVSAKTNYLRRDFCDALWRMVPDTPPDDAPRDELRLAIVGKRNAGKSTLVNTLAGEPRVIVSEIPGTTRDAIDVRLTLDARSLLVIDTAGLRRSKSLQDRVEWWALDRARRAVERADVVLMLLDATVPASQVDEQIGQMIVDAHTPVILAVNKWDLVEGRTGPRGRPAGPREFERYLRGRLKGLVFAPIVFMSGREGTTVRATIDVAFDLHAQASRRVGTGELNRVIGRIMERRGPSDRLGTAVKIYYAAQVATCPPTIVLVVNRPKLFTPAYRRYLLNRLREELPFAEVPIQLTIRARTRAEKSATRTRGVEKGEPTSAPTPADAAILAALPDDPGAYFDES